MKINSIKTYRLFAQNHYFFMTEVKNLIAAVGPSLLNIDPLFKRFTSLYNKEVQVVRNLGISSSSSKKIENSDQKRDDYFWAISLIIKSHTKHINNEIKAAAKTLLKVLTQYGNLRYIPYEEETILISNFCHDLKKHPNEVNLLNLTDWIEMLEDENIRFNDYYNSIKQEMVFLDKDNKEQLKNVRQEVDDSYKEIIEKVDALAMIEGFQIYSDFIHKLNYIIDNYCAIYSKHNKTEDKKIDDNSPVIPESFY